MTTAPDLGSIRQGSPPKARPLLQLRQINYATRLSQLTMSLLVPTVPPTYRMPLDRESWTFRFNSPRVGHLFAHLRSAWKRGVLFSRRWSIRLATSTTQSTWEVRTRTAFSVSVNTAFASYRRAKSQGTSPQGPYLLTRSTLWPHRRESSVVCRNRPSCSLCGSQATISESYYQTPSIKPTHPGLVIRTRSKWAVLTLSRLD
mmetsp:Transcript_32992/g.74668  ORF Transcript_32992/g.74668 Transcript_32992/m.74668 type:complete len:202 (+) Transcript_32992:593-1198(+)